MHARLGHYCRVRSPKQVTGGVLLACDLRLVVGDWCGCSVIGKSHENSSFALRLQNTDYRSRVRPRCDPAIKAGQRLCSVQYSDMPNVDDIMERLRNCYDPEIPLNIV